MNEIMDMYGYERVSLRTTAHNTAHNTTAHTSTSTSNTDVKSEPDSESGHTTTAADAVVVVKRECNSTELTTGQNDVDVDGVNHDDDISEHTDISGNHLEATHATQGAGLTLCVT